MTNLTRFPPESLIGLGFLGVFNGFLRALLLHRLPELCKFDLLLLLCERFDLWKWDIMGQSVVESR